MPNIVTFINIDGLKETIPLTGDLLIKANALFHAFEQHNITDYNEITFIQHPPDENLQAKQTSEQPEKKSDTQVAGELN